jgi:DENN (AEX-3) domain
LFRALNAEQVIDIFLALLLEKKVLLISKYKALLTHAAIALISFLFPLAWKHVLIPILPKSMIDVLDAPVTFLIGLEKSILKEGEQQ